MRNIGPSNTHTCGCARGCSRRVWPTSRNTPLILKQRNMFIGLHPTLSGTSGGRPVESNIEYQFSNAKAVPCGLGSLVTTSIITEGHRRASSLLDANYEISYQVARGGKQFALQKPEPMFGITVATLNKHGLANEILTHSACGRNSRPSFPPSNKSISRKIRSREEQTRPGGAAQRGSGSLYRARCGRRIRTRSHTRHDA